MDKGLTVCLGVMVVFVLVLSLMVAFLNDTMGDIHKMVCENSFEKVKEYHACLAQDMMKLAPMMRIEK